MRKILIFLIPVILFSNCSFNKDLIRNFKQQRLEVDTSIFKQKLEIIESFPLEEKKLVGLKDISGIDINSDGTKLLISDGGNGSLDLYNFDNGLKQGRIINSITAGIDLNDSLVLSGTKTNNFLGKNYKWVHTKDYQKYGFDQNDKFGGFNTFSCPKFINDSTIISLTIIYVPVIADDGFKTKFNRTCLAMLNDSLKLKIFIILENNDSSYALPNAFTYNPKNKNFFVTSSGTGKMINSKPDYQSTSLSEFNSNGKFLKIKSHLPEANMMFNQEADRHNPPFTIEMIDKTYMVYWSGIAVYDLDGNKQFDLINLPYSTRSGLKYYGKIFDDYRKAKISYQESRRIKTTLFPIMVYNCFPANDNIIIQHLVYDTTISLGYYYILQEYNSKGKLLSQTNLYDDPNNQIKYINFDYIKDCLIIFRKSKNYWTIEKRNWE